MTVVPRYCTREYIDDTAMLIKNIKTGIQNTLTVALIHSVEGERLLSANEQRLKDGIDNCNRIEQDGDILFLYYRGKHRRTGSHQNEQ